MLEELYKLYLDSGIITEDVTYDMFSQSDQSQKQGLYDLGIAQGIFETSDLYTLQGAWGEKKNANTPFLGWP